MHSKIPIYNRIEINEASRSASRANGTIWTISSGSTKIILTIKIVDSNHTPSISRSTYCHRDARHFSNDVTALDVTWRNEGELTLSWISSPSIIIAASGHNARIRVPIYHLIIA